METFINALFQTIKFCGSVDDEEFEKMAEESISSIFATKLFFEKLPPIHFSETKPSLPKLLQQEILGEFAPKHGYFLGSTATVPPTTKNEPQKADTKILIKDFLASITMDRSSNMRTSFGRSFRMKQTYSREKSQRLKPEENITKIQQNKTRDKNGNWCQFMQAGKVFLLFDIGFI